MCCNFIKVAEYQRRGLVHLHFLVRHVALRLCQSTSALAYAPFVAARRFFGRRLFGGRFRQQVYDDGVGRGADRRAVTFPFSPFRERGARRHCVGVRRSAEVGQSDDVFAEVHRRLANAQRR